jgi:hypothetical protein
MTISDFQALPPLASRRDSLRALGGAGLACLTGAALALGIGSAALESEAKKKRRKRKKRKKDRTRTQGDELRADVTCPGPSQAGFLFEDEDGRLAQMFTAGRSGRLERADLVLVKQAGASGDYILRLSPVDGAGVPTNIVLATAVIANAAVPAEAETTVRFSFASPAAVEAGTDFALVLSRPGTTDLRWEGRNSAKACPGAGIAFLSQDQSGPFDDIPFHTFILTTFVRS